MSSNESSIKSVLGRKIRVVCVDDSALIRSLLTSIINDHDDMEVVGTAPDPLVARQMIKDLNPDVITLDVEMPKMHGLDFLERLMRLRPMPVIMISSLTQRHSEISMRALELGAVDVIGKPSNGVHTGMLEYSDYIADRIRAAAMSRPRAGTINALAAKPLVTESTSATAKENLPEFATRANWLVAIGASTGGTEAILTILKGLPATFPPIVMTQHMPAGFTTSFVQRLNRLCSLEIVEAKDNEPILPGHAYLAPGTVAHLAVKRVGGQLRTQLLYTEPVNRHRPSVDVMFESVAQTMGPRATGVLLTGMGRDGARGLLAMKECGADTIVQDEASCVVFGMPKEALHMGAATEATPLNKIAERIMAGAPRSRYRPL